MSQETRFIKEWGHSPISWQQEGRDKLNAIIVKYNQWQIDGCDPTEGKKLSLTILCGMETFATRDGGEEWLKELKEMREFVDTRLEDTNVI